jgi:hypothetical protein
LAPFLRAGVRVAAIIAGLPLLDLLSDYDQVVTQVSSLFILGAVTWLMFQIVGLGERFILGLYDVSRTDNLRARQIWYTCQGIGGNNGRLLSSPLYLPVLIAVKNCSSVQLPIPVSSEVIFAANETPHGPAALVSCWLNKTQFFSDSLLISGISWLAG